MFQFPSVEDNSDEFLWVSNALQQGIIKPGQLMDVSCVTKLTTGKGYLIRIDLESGDSVYSMAYSNSAMGRSFNSIFIDPELVDDTMIQVKAQDKIKAAVCSSREEKGVIWKLSLDHDPLTIVPTKNKAAKKKTVDETAND